MRNGSISVPYYQSESRLRAAPIAEHYVRAFENTWKRPRFISQSHAAPKPL